VAGQIVDVRGMPPPFNDTILRALKVEFDYPVEGKPHVDTLTWTLGGGRLKDDGSFSWEGVIPQGTQRIKVLYIDFYPPPPTVETTMTTADVTVYPGIGAHDVRLRLNLDWNDKP
jgi:hypothetical protein